MSEHLRAEEERPGGVARTLALGLDGGSRHEKCIRPPPRAPSYEHRAIIGLGDGAMSERLVTADAAPNGSAALGRKDTT